MSAAVDRPTNALTPDPWSCAADQVEVLITPHAVQRFHERVRPSLPADRAADEIRRLIDLAVVANHEPEWLRGRARQRAPFYLSIGDVTMPLHVSSDQTGLVAVTTLARGCLSELARSRRTAARRVAARRI